MYRLPLNISFELTNSCNNSCSHCYASTWINTISRNRSNALKVAEKLASYDIFDVILTGGEPLLTPLDELCRVINIFLDRSISLSLNTNGRLLSKNTCKELRKHNLISILISLHSWDNVLHDRITNSTGAADETKHGIVNAIEAGFFVTVNQVINRQNIHTMYETAINLEKLGVDAVAMTRFIPPLECYSSVEPVGVEEFIDEFVRCKSSLGIPCNSLLPFCYCSDDRVEQETLGLNCSGGIYSAAVSSRGDVRMCVHDTKIWGNIFEENLELIWRRLSEWRREIGLPNDCTKCVYLPDCMGGCRVDGKYHTGKYNGMDSWAKRPRKDISRKTIYYKMRIDIPHLLSPNLRYRTEKQDCYLIFGNSKSMVVNQDGLELINRLPRKFVPNEIIKRGGENANLIKTFLEDLHKRMFIVEI